MAKATEDRRRALRETLIELAETRIAADGTSALKARDLATAAGCSVGAIYNVVGELHDLVVAVNGRTFLALGTHVTMSVEAAGPTTPNAQMIAMAEGYLDYASKNPLLWRALFDVELTDESDVPEWYLAALDRLLSLIDAPLRELYPSLDDDAIRLRTRALFSSVHGIVLLGLEHRISGVGRDKILDMVRFVLMSVGSEEKM